MMRLRRAHRRISVLCAGALGLALCALAQTAPPNTEEQVMTHLNLVLRWSQQWNSANLHLSRPGDLLYVENGRDLARQVVELEFQSALAEASLIGNSSQKPASSGGSSQGTADVQTISRLQQSLDHQIQGFQTQLADLNRKIPSARAKNRPALTAERDTIQGQLQLAQALQENLAKLNSFMVSAEISSAGATRLTSRILALERANLAGAAGKPAAPTGKKAATAKHGSPAVVESISQNRGLVGQLGDLIGFIQSTRALSQLQDSTTQLQTATQQLRAPLLSALRATLKQGQVELAGGGGADGGTERRGQSRACRGHAGCKSCGRDRAGNSTGCRCRDGGASNAAGAGAAAARDD